MKNLIIFEGITSSGKTTLEKFLAEALPRSTVISEGTTLMPLVENTDANLAQKFLKEQLKIISENPAKTIIIDRFHFTHAFRTQSDLYTFSAIETDLQKIGTVLVVFLTIEPSHIQERIEETIQYRKDDWKKGAQGSLEEKVAYYANQQHTLQSFVASTSLPTLTIDTTNKAWNEYAKEILSKVDDIHQSS